MVALEQIPKSYDDDVWPGHNEIFHDDVVKAKGHMELSANFMEFIGDEDHLMQRCRYERLQLLVVVLQ